MKQSTYLILVLSVLLIVTIMTLSACSAPDPVETSSQQPMVILPVPTESILDSENAYRATIGQQPLTEGLACTLYMVPTMTSEIIGATLATVGTYAYLGVLNVPNAPSSSGFGMLPATIRSVYTSYFIQKCTGFLVVETSDWHMFTLVSDDGSNLYLDGSLFINNDGLHSSQSKSNAKMLKYGVHSFEVDYLDVGGNHQLLVQKDGITLTTADLVH